MIGTDEMSSSGMDISESFRAEDLSKTDFFDFVTAPDMGIGIGVGVGVGVSLHHPHHERTSAHMTNDGGGGGGSDGGDAATNGHVRDPTLHAYDQFWNSDKDQSRLDSTIFEDLDRYCWQQHHQQQQQQQTPPQPHAPAQMSPTSPTAHLGPASSVSSSGASVNNSSVTSSGGSSSSLSQPGSAGTASSLDNTDGQIYTITVLNGNEPWLKREPEAHLPNSLDLDSLLGNFPGYIKSEYPYDDSGFGTDGAKDNGEGGAIGMQQVPSLQTMSGVGVPSSGQSLPSLMTAISVAAGGTMASDATTSVGQQFATFQNNNNDWHMVDNNADQNSAESLLRSALQGKGYSKGMQMQNGLPLLPTSPSVKEDEMRRILFPSDADTLAFADSSLGAAQMFDDAQNSPHNPHQPANHSHVASRNGPGSAGIGPAAASTTPNTAIIVEDMFLSLESAFSDDFEKIKRIANEVQQFCTSTPNVADYPGSDVLQMQISPSSTGLQQLHSPATTPTGGPPPGGPQLVVHPPQPPPQPLKPEVSTSTSSSRVPVSPSASKITKKYKRSTSSSSSQAGSSQHSSNNNNNPSVMNHNSGSNGSRNTAVSGASSGGSSSSSGANSSSPTHCNGQRKERSLHYCSICSKGFKDKYSVNVHIRTHTGEKPFACSLCGKSFRQKAHLAKHYQTHMAQKSNGSLMKSGGGGAAKHHRSSSAMAGSGSASGPVAAQHRPLGVVSGAGPGPGPSVVANGPTTVLPPANGLIANR